LAKTILEKVHRSRCGRKRGHSRATARSLAEKATLRTGDLIAPYQCLDCGLWHIGHVHDIAARICRGCSNLIPLERLLESPNATFCSKDCKKAYSHNRPIVKEAPRVNLGQLGLGKNAVRHCTVSVRLSTSRTLRARVDRLNGFCKKVVSIA
jgi:hypothetical protein